MHRTAGALLLLVLAASALAIEPPRERERWKTVTVDGLTILGSVSDRELREIANRAIRFRDAMAFLTNLRVRSPLPTKIYVFGDERSFAPYRDVAMGHTSRHTNGGVFLPRAEGTYILMYTGMQDDVTRTLQHELTHYFLLNSISTPVPLWFNEGLAELYSTFAIEGSAVKLGLPDQDYLQVLRTASLIPLRELFAIDESSTEYNKGRSRSIFYAECWALVNDLVIGNTERCAQVESYLKRIAAGDPPDEAFRMAFATTEEQMDRDLRVYIQLYSSKKPLQFKAKDIGKSTEASAPVAVAMSRDEVLAALGELLVQGTPTPHPDAEKFLREALRLNPKNAEATASLALLKWYGDKQDEADVLYALAAELGVKQWLPYAVAADKLLDRDTPTPADLAKARALYERAASLNPAAARAWAGIGTTYVGASGDVKPGIAALERCMSLDGNGAGAASDLAQLYLQDGRPADAQRLLERPPLADNAALAGKIRDALLAAETHHNLDLIQQGKEAEGTEALTKIAPQVQDLALRQEIERALTKPQPGGEEQQQARELSRARSFAVNRQWKEALEIIDRLLPAIHDPALAAQAKELRKQVAGMRKTSPES